MVYDDQRKESMKKFMEYRVTKALSDKSIEIGGNQVDRKLNPVSVKLLPQDRFNSVFEQIWESIDEYMELLVEVQKHEGE